jgi:hypothetical protein
LLALSYQFPALVAVVALIPHLFYPKGLRSATAKHDARCLLDAYLQLVQESCDDFGFLEGLWRFRGFTGEPPAGPEQGSRA